MIIAYESSKNNPLRPSATSRAREPKAEPWLLSLCLCQVKANTVLVVVHTEETKYDCSRDELCLLQREIDSRLTHRFPVTDLRKTRGIEDRQNEESNLCRALGGLVRASLRHASRDGDEPVWSGYRFEDAATGGGRVDKVLMQATAFPRE
jgi:hypothetical protein